MCVHSRLKLKKLSVMYESAHVAITFQFNTLNEIYHNTQPETILYIRTRYISQRVFRGNISDFTDLHNEKNSICKLHVNGIISVSGTRGSPITRTHCRYLSSK